MRPLSVLHLVAGALVSAFLAALGSAVSVGIGHGPALVTPYLAIVYGVLAVALFWAGRAVVRLREHKRTWMTPLKAVRTAVAARASAWTGALSVGVLGGIAAVGSTRLEAAAMSSSATGAGISALAAVVLTVTAVVVERWCTIDTDGHDGDGRDVTANSPA
ncbi:DUF3180 family protein [Actinomyces polynesiensis]|uniref:DUF3180 family protein n=1 Tax=Actinomyces polynesiensis TaxID=1325934 RepID=UPI0005B90789|nr:DUF3180 family protein [Actinomyces polynesiensis]